MGKFGKEAIVSRLLLFLHQFVLQTDNRSKLCRKTESKVFRCKILDIFCSNNYSFQEGHTPSKRQP